MLNRVTHNLNSGKKLLLVRSVREPTRNVRDRLITLLSVSSPLARQRGYLVHTLGS